MPNDRSTRAKAPAAAERQFSLILALLTTELGLTKGDIFSSVHGYVDDSADAAAVTAREKRFERDKEELRELGVPVEVIDDPSAIGNNQLARYRIPRGGFAMPAGLELDEEESTLLALAAQVWREGSVSRESRRGLMKLRSLGAATRDDLIGIAPRLRARDAAFDPLSNAIGEGRVVSFSYAKPGDAEPRLRHVEPLALVFADSSWLLVSYDLDRDDERMFLLSRIVSSPKPLGMVDAERHAGITHGQHARRALDQLSALASRQRALIEVRRGSDAELRLGGDQLSGTITDGASEWRQIESGYTDIAVLADRLASFGPEVRVSSPPELAALVASRLRLALADHDGGTA